jgi:NADPH:quinone reductase-like Zn-dependent oxidoreductase
VLIDVQACGVNHADLHFRAGDPSKTVRLPTVPGLDAAGIVRQVGARVRDHHVGDRVVVDAFVTCGECADCLGGSENRCRRVRVIGQDLDGGYAEQVAVPARSVIPIPEAWSMEEAAAALTPYVTAWHLLRTRTPLRPGQTIAITGAAGSVGAALIQLCQATGIAIYGIVSTEVKARAVQALGCSAVHVGYEGFEEWVWAETNGRGVDLVVDVTGGRLLNVAIRALARGGNVAVVGYVDGAESTIDVRYLFTREVGIVGTRRGTHAELKEVLQYMTQAGIRPPIAQRVDLRDAARAHELLESRDVVGRVVLVR